MKVKTNLFQARQPAACLVLPAPVVPTAQAPLPEWSSVVSFELAPDGIKRDAPAKVRAAHNSKVFRAPAAAIIVSDGGVGEFGAGAAVLFTSRPLGVVAGTKRHFVRRPSSFSTEAAGMLAAVELLAQHLASPTHRETIATDSLSLLESMNADGPWRASPICEPIWRVLIPLVPKLDKLRFCFVFGHCGCPVQSVADTVAGKLLTTQPPAAAYRPLWPVDVARTLFTPVRAAAVAQLRVDGHRRAQLFCRKEDGSPAPLFLPWASGLSIRRQQLLAQLRAGVCGGLGGVRHSSADSCRLCNTPNALSRGGNAVDHMFACRALLPPAGLRLASLGDPTQYHAVVAHALDFINAARAAMLGV